VGARLLAKKGVPALFAKNISQRRAKGRAEERADVPYICDNLILSDLTVGNHATRAGYARIAQSPEEKMRPDMSRCQ